jgi:hypothetical protein
MIQNTGGPGRDHLSEAKRALLEKYLQGKPGDNSGDPGAIVRHSHTSPAPLSLAQRGLWLRELSVPHIPPLYNECVTVRMEGELDVAALERGFNEIVRRHEMWRTTFEIVGEQPVQVIHTATSIELPVIDLRGLPEVEREGEAIRRVKEDTFRPFDMREGPLLRPTLIRMSETEHRLFLVAHQIVLDGMSAYQIFPSELAILYKVFSTGKPSPLPELPVQCADFAHWQREWLPGEVLARQISYWRAQLGDHPAPLQWPTGRPRPAALTFRGTIRPFALSRQLTAQLKELSLREGSTLFMTLLAGLAALMYSYTRQDDLVLGTLSPSGRKRSEVLGLLGYFLNPVALRLRFGAQTSFRELLHQVRNVTSEAMSNDDVPIEYLARELSPQTDPSRSPFFTVAASLQPPMPELGLPWLVTSMDVENGGASWDLYVAFIDGPNGLMGRAQYNPDLFETETIARFQEDLRVLLEIFAANPERLVQDRLR